MHYHLKELRKHIISIWSSRFASAPWLYWWRLNLCWLSVVIQHLLRHVDEGRCAGCDDCQINKLNRSEVSVDVNSYYLLSPSDPRCRVQLAPIAVYTPCCTCRATWDELELAVVSNIHALDWSTPACSTFWSPCFLWKRMFYMTSTR